MATGTSNSGLPLSKFRSLPSSHIGLEALGEWEYGLRANMMVDSKVKHLGSTFLVLKRSASHILMAITLSVYDFHNH